MKRRVNSRKADCPECKVQTGSHHNKVCQFAYKPYPNTKQVANMTIGKRLKIAAQVLFTK